MFLIQVIMEVMEKSLKFFWKSVNSGTVPVMCTCWLQAECLVETQANVYDRFLSGMMAKDKKQDEKSEEPDEDQEDDPGGCFVLFFSDETCNWQKTVELRILCGKLSALCILIWKCLFHGPYCTSVMVVGNGHWCTSVVSVMIVVSCCFRQ